MSLHDRSVVEKTESHICTAQSDSVSSLQFDKRQKSRCYQSQFSINDQILVAVTRREIDKPIKNTVIVEVDLSVGITDDIESSRKSKYQKPCHLDEMAKTDNWVNKMITYDVFDDKTVMKTIRDEAMEPNKLYLLKHKHKEETSEKLTKTFVDDLEIDRKNMRSTAAQFNPGDFRKPELVDKMIYPSENSNSLNIFLKSKNVLRNELIIHTGDIKRPSNPENNNYSSKLSINLSLQDIPNVSFEKDPINDTKDEQDSYNPWQEDKNNDEFIEKVYEEKEKQSLKVEDIPFAEETDASEHEPIEGSPNKISKSLQYFLPVFSAPLANCESSETLNFERSSNYSREDVTTDENESFNNTSDRRKMTDFDEFDSLSAASYEEFVTDSVKQSIPISDNKETKSSSSKSEIPPQTEKEQYLMDSQKYLLNYDDWKDIFDVRCQENMVLHVNVDETPHIVYMEDRPKVLRTVSESNFSFAQHRIEPLKANIFIIKPTKLKDFYNNIDIGFPTDTAKDSKETPNLYNEMESPLEEEFLASENCMTPSNSVDEDSQIFSKSKSFSLKRKSDLIENYVVERNDQMLLSPSFYEIPQYSSCDLINVNSNSDSNSFEVDGSNQSQSLTNSVTSERKEKFLKSDFNSNIIFFKPVSDTVSPPNSRNSTPSLTENTESFKKPEMSSHSSEGSMIIKDVSSGDAYVFPKPQKNLGYDVLHEESEDESEKRSRNNTESEFSSFGTSDEEHFKKDCQASKESASCEESSSDTETINELYTRDFVTTPIERSGEKYDQFLKNRILRMSQEESTKDKSSSLTDEGGISLTENTNENCSNDFNNNQIIDEESSYTEDTSSSSSEYSPIVNPILRQGESIEEIEKFLNLHKQDRTALRRSSGFESQLNEVYHHENDEKNLLYNNERNRHSLSTSSSNDSYSVENQKERKESDNLLKINELIIASKPFTKQISVPISGQKDPYNSSSQSESTMSISTTTEESNVLPEKQRTPNNIERGEKNLNYKPLSKQISVPIPKKRFSLSSQRDLPKESFTVPKKKITEINEPESVSPIYIDKEEKVLNPENPQNLLSYSKSHEKQSDSFSESETSVTLSTTSRETQPENETIDDTNALQYRQNSITEEESKPFSKEEITNSSEDEDNTISFSSSTEDLAPQQALVTKESLVTRQTIDKPIASLYSTKVESDASSSRSSSYSLSTSSDESKKITQPTSNDRSEDLIKSGSKPLFISKKNKINSSEDKDKKGLSIDRREKFTKLDKSYIKSNFKRSESVPNYLEDSQSAADSFNEDDNNIIPAKFSQSLKNISNVSEDEPLKKDRSHGYELISVTLKEDDNKNVHLSIDRREKFFMPKDFDKISSMDNLKNEKPVASFPDAKSSSSGSSTSISTSSSTVSDNSDEEKMSLESLQTNSESHLSGEMQNKEMNAVDEENKYYNGKRDLSNSSDSISTTSSSSEDEEDEDDKQANNRPDDKINEPVKVIDRTEKFTDLDNSKDKLVSSKRNNTKNDNQKSSSSSASNSSSSFTKSKSSNGVANKSIDHKEKFAVTNLKSNIQGKKKKGKESSESSSFSVSTSSKTSLDKKEKDNQIKKSDSTDEDISLSLSSSVHEPQETKIILNNKENEIFPENLVKESKIKVDDSDDSLGFRPEEKTNNKTKYDKSKINPPVNYNTLPYKRPPNIIQFKEKSKSLDKPLTPDQFMYKHPDIPGSMGDIVESRYHEVTETWSRQSPVDPKMLNKKEKVPETNKPQKPKIDNSYNSPKWSLPLTTRPRPVPSYLSPINAYPWVPTDQEFGSVDSIVSDYSKDYNDEEPLPKYKSLPEFLTSVATKNLPKQPEIPKHVVKKPVPKTKIQPEFINLDYGIKESKTSSSAYDVRKKASLTSVTTDSSYLDKPILKEIPDNNFASFESLSSLTPQSSTTGKLLKNNKSKLPNQNSKIINQHISSTSSSSDTDTEVEPKKIPPKVVPKFQSSYNQQNIDRKAHMMKANSLPSKRIPSSSESSEFSSTSEESSSSIHRF